MLLFVNADPLAQIITDRDEARDTTVLISTTNSNLIIYY